LRITPLLKRPFAFVLLVMGLLYMGSFEWMREASRRPYVISDYMYSSSILKSDLEAIDREGVLKKARWVRNRAIVAANMLEAGKEMFGIQCLPCHTVGGMVNDILPKTARFSLFGMDAMLNGMGEINGYMPPFMGTLKERKALAAYIVTGLHKKEEDGKAPVALPRLPFTIPAFDDREDAYVLLAWNDLGMHGMTDNDGYLSILPPGNTLYAQLIKRGELPEIVTQGMVVTYQVEPGHERPSKHVSFWEYVNVLFGKDLEPDTGLAGKGMSGDMDLKKNRNAFVAERIPVVPYSDDGPYNPYPFFTIQAMDKGTGKAIAETRCVAPASTEMG
ncbi:MAG: cytochrome c, partial [Deltaproteobacteria bacterium]|nr:cytochrome c [Deltaproteobacteria bacterium]